MADPNAAIIAQEAESMGNSALAIARILREAPVAMNQGDQILRELREGFRSVNARLDSVEARLDSVEARLDSMEARMGSMEARQASFATQQRALEANAITRMINYATARDGNSDLASMRNAGNEEVPNFPPNVQALGALSSEQLTALLRAFDQPTTGNLATKRERFRYYIGIYWPRV